MNSKDISIVVALSKFTEKRIEKSIEGKSLWDRLPTCIKIIIFEFDSTKFENYNKTIDEYKHTLNLYSPHKQFIHLEWNNWFYNNTDRRMSTDRSNLFSKAELYQCTFPYYFRLQKKACVHKIQTCSGTCSYCSKIVQPHRYKIIFPDSELFCSRKCHIDYYESFDKLRISTHGDIYQHRPVLHTSPENSVFPGRFMKFEMPIHPYLKPKYIDIQCRFPNYWILNDKEQWEIVPNYWRLNDKKEWEIVRWSG